MNSMKNKFILIAGPCVIESESIVLEIANQLKESLDGLDLEFYFKASFDKANRTSLQSFRGPGLDVGLKILSRVKKELNFKITTDIHEPYQAAKVAEIADIIQIPAFLCRQTDLLIAAAQTGKTINVKKGQFLAPWDMGNVVNKLEESGCKNIILCERGIFFGYNRLVVDMTGIMEMKKLGYPVIFDATHSVQQPGGAGNSTSGNREYVPYLAKAAVAAGADGLFLETHLTPEKALSDGPNMIPVSEIRNLVETCLTIKEVI